MDAYRDQYAQLFNAGRNVVLIAISADAPDVLASWAKDDEFPPEGGQDTVDETAGVEENPGGPRPR